MKRLSFLKLLFHTGIITLVPVSLLAKKNKTKLLSCSIAGFQYYEGPSLVNSLKPQNPVELQREPENKFDKYAIAVYYQNKKIGFVPRDENKLLARILDNNLLEVKAEIKEVDTNPQYSGAVIEIFRHQHKL